MLMFFYSEIPQKWNVVFGEVYIGGIISNSLIINKLNTFLSSIYIGQSIVLCDSYIIKKNENAVNFYSIINENSGTVLQLKSLHPQRIFYRQNPGA
jgi:hypothetical protein